MSTVPLPKIPPPAPRGGGHRLLIALAIVGGVLLLAVVATVSLLIGRTLGAAQNSSAPQTSAPPAPRASMPSDETPAPGDATPRFTEFTAVTEVRCPKSGKKRQIEFTWETAHAVEVWYTTSNDDAIEDGFMQVPVSGSQRDLSDEPLFPCGHRESQEYTLTLLGENGEHVSTSWTVVDLNWKGGDDD